MTKDTKDYSSLLRMGRVKSLLLMFTMLMIWGTIQSMAQTDSPVTFHNASIGGVSLSWDTDNKGKVITTNDADEAQQWVVEYAEGSTTDFYLKNVGSNTYLTIGTANNWDMTFISSSNLATYADRAKYSLKELTNGNYGINTKHQNKYIGTDKTSHLTRGLSPCDSITDIAKQKNVIDPNGVIANWMRNRNTIEFLGLWETLYNPNFNPLEFEGFRRDAGVEWQ